MIEISVIWGYMMVTYRFCMKANDRARVRVRVRVRAKVWVVLGLGLLWQ